MNEISSLSHYQREKFINVICLVIHSQFYLIQRKQFWFLKTVTLRHGNVAIYKNSLKPFESFLRKFMKHLCSIFRFGPTIGLDGGSVVDTYKLITSFGLIAFTYRHTWKQTWTSHEINQPTHQHSWTRSNTWTSSGTWKVLTRTSV